MRKKIFFLLISWMLVASCGLYAQSSEFILDDEKVVDTVQPNDTLVQRPKISQIQVLERTWGDNLEDLLKDKIIFLSTNQNNNRVSKKEVHYVYKVHQVPCKSGKQTVYLSMTDEREFYLSKQDPLTMDEICECFLDLALPDNINASPCKYQTDNKIFGQPVSNGKDLKIKNSPLF